MGAIFNVYVACASFFLFTYFFQLKKKYAFAIHSSLDSVESFHLTVDFPFKMCKFLRVRPATRYHSNGVNLVPIGRMFWFFFILTLSHSINRRDTHTENTE